MLRDLDGLQTRVQTEIETAKAEANSRIAAGDPTQHMRFALEGQRRNYYATKSESQDWFFALGGFTYWYTAEIEVHTESGIDTLIVLRFALDQSALDSFLTNAGYTEPLKEGFRPFSSQELRDVPWWNPDEAKEVMGGFLNTSDWASEVMVDVSGSQPVVYLKTHDL
ncbi:MAG: hypothetical protein RIE73_20405 [Coleofasciculus sp. C1-SOL-03]